MNLLMGIGIGLGAVVGGYLLFMVLGTIFTGMAGRAPAGIEVDVSAPRMVRENEPFELAVTIRDTLGRERQLRSIDLDSSLLKGFVIESIEPVPLEPHTTLGTRVHPYDRAIPGHGLLRVLLRCRGAVRGDFEGDVTVYVDSGSFRFIAHNVRLVIRPGP